MMFRTRSARPALAAAVALLAISLAAPAGPATAGATPTDSIPAVPAVPATPEAPAEPTDPAGGTADTSTDEQVEFVQRWTLTAGGGADGSEVGSRPNLTYQLAPGAVIEDSVVVFNLGNLPMEFRVYATDAFNNDDGAFDLIPADEAPVDAGSWVELVQERIVLDPGKQATIPFTLTVPIDARPGDHVGAIVAGNTNTADSGGGQVVEVERRTGVRLYVQVDGPLQPDLAVRALTTDYDHSPNPLGGTAEVTFVVENRGNIRLGGTPILSVGGPFGIGQQEIALPTIAELLPGEEIDFTTTLDNVPALFLETTTVRIDIEDPAERGGAEALETRSRSFVPPITVLLVLMLVALLVLARRAFGRRRTALIPVAPIARPGGPGVAEREPQHQ